MLEVIWIIVEWFFFEIILGIVILVKKAVSMILSPLLRGAERRPAVNAMPEQQERGPGKDVAHR